MMLKSWFSYIAAIADCRMMGRNRLSIDFTLVKLPVKLKVRCLPSDYYFPAWLNGFREFLLHSDRLCFADSSTDTYSITFSFSYSWRLVQYMRTRTYFEPHMNDVSYRYTGPRTFQFS